jgi:hypothetical protein
VSRPAIAMALLAESARGPRVAESLQRRQMIHMAKRLLKAKQKKAQRETRN